VEQKGLHNLDANVAEAGTEEHEKAKSWPVIIAYILGLIMSLYVFLVGLELLGDSFKCLGGKGAGSMFTAISNPVAGLMTGILATVMVQSSSTSTSIVVGLVGAEQISVTTAIPIIMGANIGTSVTNTIVSMGQAGNRLDLERAFAGATVHDMFNYLSVAVLLPIEVIAQAIQGQGGPLFWLTQAITDAIMGSRRSGELFNSPITAITDPVSKLFLHNNKYIIYALSLGEPTASTSNVTNATACASLGDVGCSSYYCLGEEMNTTLYKINKAAYRTHLTGCEGYITEPSTPCGSHESCFLDAGAFYDEYVSHNPIINGGITQGAGDIAGGIIGLVLSLLFLIGGLFFLCKFLHALLMGRAKRVIAKATRLNDYLAILVGVGVTIIVQSSSVVTSALTPFCGLGVLPLEKMLPLTLGANIGTTVTALIASMATFTNDAVHIALCHLFFNIFGILIWFPVPFMRRVPLGAARLLGLYASFFRMVPLIYILVAFVLVPSVALGISALFGASLAAGVVVLVLVLAALGALGFLWVWKEWCYRVLSKEDREAGLQELEAAQREFCGQKSVTGHSEGEQQQQQEQEQEEQEQVRV